MKYAHRLEDELPMVARFQRRRWSVTRRQIDAMGRATRMFLDCSEYYNAKASVERLNDAYEGHRWYTLSRNRAGIEVRRVR